MEFEECTYHNQSMRGTKMPFLMANIDRAIVMTQYDLRGFAHPLGFRSKPGGSPKGFSAIPGNFVSFAAGFGKAGRPPTVDTYVSALDGSFDEYLAMCRELASDCELSQKEAIQLIVRDIVRQSEEYKAKVARGEAQPSSYLQPLEKDNSWGKTVLALAEAFEVSLEQPST